MSFVPILRDPLEALDKFDLINIINAISDHGFLLRLAFSTLDDGTGWVIDSDPKYKLNQGLILINLYLDKVDYIIRNCGY